jgi:4-diphosphocytidyl-2C-methyl-D-erythritol kinase
VELASAEGDRVDVAGRPAPADHTNLAWRAVEAVREAAGSGERVEVVLDKGIPSGAGLGGGSADAAAALVLASRHFEVTHDVLRSVAPELGSDVPFALVGGSALVAGTGELVQPLPDLTGFALAVVVPPVELPTAAVYQTWDELGAPSGPRLEERHLPPALREYAPLANDLYPAAVTIAPAVEEWRAELARSWGSPVAMTGSGAGLFSFFATSDEAESALEGIPLGARAAEAVEPIPRGWELLE